MFIPIRTDRPPKRTPVITQALIVVNLGVYLVGAAGAYFHLFEDPQVLTDWGRFDPQHFKVWQLVSYQFIHDPHGIWHIAFNMLFLWVFGAAVEDRLGRPGFLAFYIFGGALAGLAHAAFNPSPVIGASGSIAGVTGAFLALFPRSRILVIFFLFGFVSIPSIWFIGLYIGLDVLRQLGDVLGSGGSNVAYMAHIAGYAYGFSVGFGLLATKLLKREEFDIFFLVTQARRRAAFRAASREGPAGLWGSAQSDTDRRLRKRAERGGGDEPDPRAAELRAEIYRALSDGDVNGAAQRYRRLLAEAPTQGNVLSEQGQLDVASQLFADHAHEDAARAYELLLDSYPGSPKTSEVRLILALLYARHLNRPGRALELIELVRPGLRDSSHRKLADELLAEIGT